MSEAGHQHQVTHPATNPTSTTGDSNNSNHTATPSGNHSRNNSNRGGRGGGGRGRGRARGGRNSSSRGRGRGGRGGPSVDAPDSSPNNNTSRPESSAEGREGGAEHDSHQRTAKTGRRNRAPGNRGGRRSRGGAGGGESGGAVGGRGRGRGKSAAVVHDDEDGDEVPLCVVCAEELVYFAVGECNHPGRCATCAVRSRMLLKDRSCPECKAVQDRLVVAELPADGVAPRFESFNLWGDFAGPDSVFNDAWGMIFNACRSHYDYLIRATGFFCPVEGCSGDDGGGGNGGGVFQSKGALEGHMKYRHQRSFCNLCLDSRPLFLSEQEVFTVAGLRKHESGVDGHPLCRFCNKRKLINEH